MKVLSVIFCCVCLQFRLCRHITLAKSGDCGNITQLINGITDMPTLIPTLVPSRSPSGVPSSASSLEDATFPTDFQSGTQSGGPKTRPNIMIIMADDVGIGDIIGKVDTPNIDNLAKKGVSFHNAHATPLCAPSRYSLLSGNYQFRGRRPGGTWTLENSNFIHNQLGLAKVLRDGGNYNTNVVGKWHLGAKIQPHGMRAPVQEILSSPLHNWTLPLLDGTTSLGFDSSYITIKGIQGAPYTFFRDDFLATKEVKNWVSGQHRMPHGMSELLVDGQGAPDWDSSAYNMILVNETEKFLDRHLVGPQKPFFSYVALGAAHEPHSPPDKYIDGDLIAGQYPVPFLDMLLEMDKTVGSIVKALKDRQLVDNTLIIFLSDNGGLQPEKSNATSDHLSNIGLRGGKGEIYEGGHRIPLIMRHDGVFPAGQSSSALVGINDIFATVCDFAGVAIPKLPTAKDSISFADFIKKGSSAEPPREFLYVSRYKSDILITEAGITETFKLVHFLPTRTDQTPRIEFYNLEKDPMEKHDLRNEQIYASEIKKIWDQMNLINKHQRPTLYPTTSPRNAPSAEPTSSFEPSLKMPPIYPTTSPTETPSSNPTPGCDFNNKKKCKRNSCAWNKSNTKCRPCISLNARKCVNSGCILWPNRFCSSCTGLRKKNFCLKNHCVWSAREGCKACISLTNKKSCEKSECVWDYDKCVPCSNIPKKYKCNSFESCVWLGEQKDGKCGRVD